MTPLSFGGLLVVSVVALAAPLLVGLAPRARVPADVVAIVGGIVLGPSLLGWVEIDVPIAVLSLLGLAFLLFPAGLELDLDRLRWPVLRLAGGGFLLSLGLGAGAGYAFHAAGWVRSPLLLAVALSATSLGLVVPILEDAGQLDRDLGQLVVAGASVADFGAIVLLSFLFLGEHLQHRHPAGPARRPGAARGGRRAGPVAGVDVDGPGAGLLQATSLLFLVTAVQIGLATGTIGAATGAALVFAGLLSVVVFPVTAPALLGRPEPRPEGDRG